MRADVAAHVFDQAENFEGGFLAKGNFASNVVDRQHLRRGDENGSKEIFRSFLLFQHGHHGDVFVGSARRRVDDQIIQFGPIHSGQQTLDHGDFSRSSPDDRVVGVVQEQRHGHQFQFRCGKQFDRRHSIGRLVNGVRRILLDAEHSRNRRSAEINVEQTDPKAALVKRQSELSSDGRFA